VVTNILITNVHSANNAGDQVLLSATIAELRANFQDAGITVAMNDPRSFPPNQHVHVAGSFTHWFQGDDGRWRKLAVLAAPWLILQAIAAALVHRLTGLMPPLLCTRSQRALLYAYQNADLVLSCPGNFFFSGSGIGLPFFLAVLSLMYGWLAGKPLYMMPQTIGPLRRRREQRAIRWLLEHVRIVLLRDEVSRATLEAIGLRHSRCHVLPDIAFLYRDAGDLTLLDQAQAELTALYRPLVGVTVINWLGHDPHHARPEVYEASVTEALRSLLRAQGGTAILFPQVRGPSVAEDDRPPAQRIAHQLRSEGLAVVALDSEPTPAQLRAAYGQMDIFLGTRLHSNIFALTKGTPVLAIAYQYKTRGIMSMLGLEDWVIEIGQVTPDRLSEMLVRLWEERAQVREHIRLVLPEIQCQARQACTWIRADFEAITR
jgi:colanic acid/amylovoran biosynthesis protein